MRFVSEVFIRSGKTRLINRMTRGWMSWGWQWQRVYLYFAAVVIISASICAQTDTRQAEENFERWAKIHATPIQSVELRSDPADMRPLKSMIGSARVVAFGEAAHG